MVSAHFAKKGKRSDFKSVSKQDDPSVTELLTHGVHRDVFVICNGEGESLFLLCLGCLFSLEEEISYFDNY